MTPANPPPAPTQSRPRKRAKWVIIGMVALVVCFGLYLITHKAPPKAGRVTSPITITTATATKGDIGNYIKRIGNVVPVYTASIFSQVTGVVNSVNYQEGQIVNKGDPLVDIDARQYEATLMQAQGTLEKDQNVQGQAEMDLKRYQDAWARNAVAKQLLDDQEKLVLQAQGTVKNDQGTVNFDQLQVDYCHITAPFTGRVGLRPVDPGNLITAGNSATPLAVITQLQPITAVFSIEESNDSLGAVLAQLKNNAKLAVDAYSSDDTKKLASGEFLALDSQIDTTTGTVKVRATFPNDDMALFPNQFINVHLLVQTLTGVTLIPTATIQQNGQTSFVYVIENNTARVQNVTPGVVDDKLGITQVEGINPGDVVANSSFDKLQDGSKVTVESEKTPGGKGSQSPAADGSPSPHKHGGHANGSGSDGSGS